jgi:hypothetical protein
LENIETTSRGRAAVPSHLLAWGLLAAVNMVATAIEPLPRGGIGPRLLVLAIDGGQLLAIGLAIEVGVRLVRRFTPRVAWRWAVLVLLSMVLAALTLPEDLAGVVDLFA